MRSGPLLFLAGTALVAAACAGASPRAERSLRGLIVYWSDRSGAPAIWSIRPDGTHRHRILRTKLNEKRARLSPDRKWVAFDGTPKGKPAFSDFDVQVARIDGTEWRALTSSSDRETGAQWSPDGRTLSYERWPADASEARDYSVWTVGRDGTDARRLAIGLSARWSPDGKRLVYTTASRQDPGDLFTINADGTDSRLLLSRPDIQQAAAWSRDGRKILFTSWKGQRAGVYVMDADGSDVRRLGRGIAACWSPTGSRILYTHESQLTPISALRVMNTDGSGKRVLPVPLGAEPDWR